MDHDGRPGLDGCRADRCEDPRDVADHPVRLDRALEERRLHAGVIDALADLADEDLGDRVDRPVGEEVRQPDKGVQPARDDDVQIHRVVDSFYSGDEPSEARGGRIDERVDAGLVDRAQLRDRVRDAELLVPVGLPERVAVVRECLGLDEQDVLVHQCAPERLGVDGSPHGLDGAHRVPLSRLRARRRESLRAPARAVALLWAARRGAIVDGHVGGESLQPGGVR